MSPQPAFLAKARPKRLAIEQEYELTRDDILAALAYAAQALADDQVRAVV